MGWNRAGGLFSHRIYLVVATGWTFQHLRVLQLQIRSKLAFGRYVGRLFLFFQRPLLFRTFDLSEIIDAGVDLRRVAGFNEIGDCNRQHHGNDNYRQRNSNVAGNQTSDGQTLPRYGATRTFDSGQCLVSANGAGDCGKDRKTSKA